MRYILNLSPAETAARLRLALRGDVAACFNTGWKTDPPTGFYGAVETDRFEIGFFDGLASPHPRRLVQTRLVGTLRETPGGTELTARFRFGWILMIMAAAFVIAAVTGLITGPQSQDGRLIAIPYAVMVVFILAVGFAFLRGARNRNFRELETILSDCIAEKHTK